MTHKHAVHAHIPSYGLANCWHARRPGTVSFITSIWSGTLQTQRARRRSAGLFPANSASQQISRGLSRGTAAQGNLELGLGWGRAVPGDAELQDD